MVLQDEEPAAAAPKDDNSTAGAAFFDTSYYYMASGIGTIIWAAYIMPLIGKALNSADVKRRYSIA